MTIEQSPTAFGAASQAADDFACVANTAAEHSSELLVAGLETWNRETQLYYDELSSQTAVVLDQLRACKSPLDLMGVEQSWIAARSKAHLDSGQRFVEAVTRLAQDMTKEPAPRA